MFNIAIENDHRNSEFSHKKMVDLSIVMWLFTSFFCTPGMAAMVPYTIQGQASACIPSWDCPEPGDAGGSDRIGCQKSWIL